MEKKIWPKSWEKALAENADEIIHMIRELFVGRDDVFAIQVRKGKSCIYRPIRRKLTDNDIMRHLRGEMTIAVYPEKGAKTKTGCVDIDSREESEVERVLTRMKEHGIKPIVEDSGCKGFHGWIHFDRAITKCRARAISRAVACGHEVFPKQDYIPNDGYGSLTKLPWGIHVVSGRFCRFVDDRLQPVPDQWKHLQNVTSHHAEAIWEKVAASMKDEIEECRGAGSNVGKRVDLAMIKQCVKALVQSGVDKGQRNVACHVVACACRRSGMPEEHARIVLRAFNNKNRPPLPMRELRSIVSSAYSRSYEYGCNPDGILHSMAKCVSKERCPFYRRLIEKKR